MSEQTIQSALVLSPHPDDESLGCGGTIKLLTQAGGRVDVVYMTRGEQGGYPGASLDPAASASLAGRRVAEAREACRMLGVSSASFLPGRDGHVASQPELSGEIARALKAFPYRSVFCPWPHDRHVDHMATYRWLHEALREHTAEIDLWLYEVWSPLTPNIFISIDTTIDAKMQAFMAHRSQAELLGYGPAFRGLAEYRGLFCPPSRFAEAFFNCDRSSLLNHRGLPWPQPEWAATGNEVAACLS